VLRLSDRPAVSAAEIGAAGPVLWVRLAATSPDPDAAVRGAYGWATGDAAAVSVLRTVAARWSGARRHVAALVTATGVAVFEGHACTGCVAAHRGDVAVAGVGLDQPDVAAFASHLSAVEGDIVDRLLRFAAAADELWPHRPGPTSAMLVVIGPDRVREEIAVDEHGRVGRRLVARHLRHLADVEVPFELAQAQDAWARGDDEALVVHRRRALAAGRRALEAFPEDAQLRRHMRVADALLPEHLCPTP
jgi:hypothetical protein